MTRPLISADSHVIEPTEIWDDILPDGFWGDTHAAFSAPGGFDPKARTDEMDTDKVSAEVLYPSLAMKLYGLEDPKMQEASFKIYNDWLAEYCAVSPSRLFGLGMISSYNTKNAVEEIQRCADMGIRGIMLWQIPHPDYPFAGTHYEPIWEAAAALGLPVSLHILTGFGYATDIYRIGHTLSAQGEKMFKLSINRKLGATMDALLEIVVTGALDRHENLKLVTVENEAGWLPYFVDQLDYYYNRYQGEGASLNRLPSEVFKSQVFTTFFRDPNIPLVAAAFGDDNIMWSSDYPHGNSTWPESQNVVQDRLGSLEESAIEKVVWGNVTRLYDIDSDAVRAAGTKE